MLHGGNFVIKNNFFMTQILRRFYGTVLECTKGNDNDDGFICKNVVIFDAHSKGTWLIIKRQVLLAF